MTASFITSPVKQQKRSHLAEYTQAHVPRFQSICLMPGWFAKDVVTFIDHCRHPYDIVMVEENPVTFSMINVEPDGIHTFRKFNRSIYSFAVNPPDNFTFDMAWLDLMRMPRLGMLQSVVMFAKAFIPHTRPMVLAFTAIAELRGQTMGLSERQALFGSAVDVCSGVQGWLIKTLAERGIDVVDVDPASGYYHATKRSAKMLQLNMCLRRAA